MTLPRRALHFALVVSITGSVGFAAGEYLAKIASASSTEAGSVTLSATTASATTTVPSNTAAPSPKKGKAANSKASKPQASATSQEPATAASQNPSSQGENAPESEEKLKEEEHESPNMARLRAEYFQHQRAYPFKHVPAGALQKALAQRDAMKQRQKQQQQAKSAAQAIITFPGNGLWQLTGPQPVDFPFGSGTNEGNPNASGRITAVAIDPTDTTGQTLYVGGAAGGVWKTTNGGSTWTPLTDSQPSLAVGSIAIDPNSCSPAPCTTIYVGTGEDDFNHDGYYGAGVLKSTNGGTTWTQLGASSFVGPFAADVGGAQIGGIAVQPGNSNVVLAAVDFFDGNDTNGGIWISTNGGTTWGRPTSGAQGSAGTGVVFDPSTPANAYAALGDAFGATSNGVYKSTNGGTTWTLLAGGLPTTNVGRITLGYAPSTTGSTATIYAAIADSSTNSSDLLGIYKTTNGGTTWTAVTGPPGGFCNHQCYYDMAIGVHPTNPNVVVIGGGAYTDNYTSLFESTNGGSTWTGTTTTDDFMGPSTNNVNPHVDTHAIVFTPSTDTLRLYIGDDGGMWRTDGPVTGAGVASPSWVDLNATLATLQFYPGVSMSQSDDNYGIGGTQDNGTDLFTGNLDWTWLDTCGDGGPTAFDSAYPTTIYVVCSPFSSSSPIWKSVFNGQNDSQGNESFNAANNGISASDESEFIPPMTLDKNTPTNLYYGTCRIWQTTDSAGTWSAITGDLSSGNAASDCTTATNFITTIDVDGNNSDLVLAATSNGTVWATQDASLGATSTWTEIDNGLLPSRYVTTVRIDKTDATGETAYVSFSGFGSCTGCDGKGHIFKTTNAGTAWTDISGDLPDAPINDVLLATNNGALLAVYVGTDVGVFACYNPGASPACSNWTVVGDGLPNSPVLALAGRQSFILQAATHGRSMWNIQITEVPPGSKASLASLTPAAVMVGAATTNVTVTGVNFSTNTQVLFDGVSVGTPTFVNTTQLTISVSSSLFTNGQVYQVTVSDPQGASSKSLQFAVMNPILTANTMSPSTTTTYTPVTLTFSGSSFVAGTAVTFNGVQLVGGSVTGGGSGFTVPVPVSLLTTTGTFPVAITNPLPGGGPTPATQFSFTVSANVGPTAIVSPSPIILGPINLGTTTSPATNVSITNYGTTNALHITAQSITGTNAANFAFAAPTSGTSCGFPTSGQSGTTAVTLNANGGTCNFGITYTAGTPPGAAVSLANFNLTDDAAGSPQATPVEGVPNISIVEITPVSFGGVAIGTTSATTNATLVNSTSSTLTVNSTGITISGTNAADFHLVPAAAGGNTPCAGFASFSVNPESLCDVGVTFTPSIAGNESATISVSDNGPGSPQSAPLTGVGIELTSISPSIVATGGPAFTLTVNGGGFVSSAVVNVNGSARLTTFVSSTQLLASIPASDIATAGSLAITVTSPSPGGTTSEPKTLFVAQAEPATNDNINFATTISTTPFRTTQDTTQATENTGGVNDPTTSCGSNSIARSVWFKFVAPAAGRVIANTRFSSYTTIVSAWTGTPGSLTLVSGACANGNVPASSPIPAQSLIGFAVTSGTTYYIMVTDQNTAGAGGTLTFSLDFASAAPANDPFSAPTVIAAAPFSTSENTILATANTGGAADPVPSCASGTAGLAGTGVDNSVWFSYTPTSNGTITADTLTSPYETILTAVTGTTGSFTQVACNVSAGSGVSQSQVSFAATSGTTYYFMVSSVLGDGGTTNFHLTFSTSSVGPATKLAFTTQPSNVAAGASITPAVQVSVEDASGNVVTTATNSITIAISTNPSSGTLSGTLTVPAVNGVATFSNLSINRSGTGYVLGASASGLTSATSSAFNVTAGVASQLAFTVQPTNVTAGASITPAVQVTVEDALGNTVTTATNSITMAISTNPSGGTLSGTTPVAAVNGVATFSNLSINKSGTGYTLAASASGLTGATSSAFNVTAGTASKLAFTVQPSNVGAGAVITPAVQVTVQDALGNTVTTATNSITMAISTNPSGGTLSGTTPVAAVNGVATFSNLSINNAGTGYTLAASTSGLTGATSTAFNVTAGGATKLAFTVQPSNVAAGASITPAVQVTVQDASGNTVTSATNSITIAISTNPSSGTLSGTTTLAAVNGVATFSTLSINKSGTGYVLGASASGLTSATSSAFNVTAGTASKLAFTVQPTNVAAGASITPAVQVTVEDANGNTVTTATNSITMAISTNPSGGTLSGTTPVAAVNGVATFSNLSINKSGTGYVLGASATGLTSATSSAFNVTAGTATQLVFTVQPSNVAAGASITPAVQVSVEDANGNVVTNATNSITMAISTNPSGGTLSGTTPVAAVNGVATFSNLSINKSGTGYTLGASASGLTGATSGAFNVAAGTASQLAFTVQPSNVGAGASITPAVQVTVEDAQGNTVTTATNAITIAIGTNPGGGTLSGTTTVNATAGVATFSNLSINFAGAGYTLKATATGLTSATSNAFTVSSASAAKLAFTVQPSSAGAGSTISPAIQVTVEDAFGNPVTSATNSITLAITTNPSSGTLSGTTTEGAVNGVATFSNLSINAAGTGYVLTASTSGLTSGTSNPFNITSGTPAKLAFTVQPSNVSAGASITPAVQVTVEDAQGNPVTTATNQITMAISTNPSAGTLSGTLTVAAINGVATFSNLSINNLGTGYTLAATATGLTSATSAAFNVTAGAPAKLAFTVQPSNVASGASITPAVQVSIEDAGGNLVTTATNSVTIAIGTNPSSGTLSGTLTMVAVGGIATFSNLSINKAATGYTLGASATGLTSATSSAFNVAAGAASQLAFTVQPTNVAAGASITPAVQVTVEDANGNTVTSATNSITMAISTNPSSGALSGTLTLAAVSGIATFSNLSINKAGTGYTLAASATGLTSATSSAFNVTAGAASLLAFSVQPTNVAAGASITPAVQVSIEDAEGNVVASATNSITIAISTNPSAGTLSGTLTIAAVSGVATFSNLSINKLGTGYTLAASATGLTGATSNPFNVTVGAPAKLAFTVQPSNVASGAAITPAVQVSIQDAGGNLVTTATNSVTMAIGTNPSSGTLGGTTTEAAVAGVATFSNLTLTKAGTGYTLSASASGLTSATSAAFNVVAGPPATVTATSGTPQATVTGTPFGAPFVVTVTDANSNLVSGALVTFTPPGSGASGTFAGGVKTASTNTSGVATSGVFTANSTAGGPYNVVASATGATSANFVLTNDNPTPVVTLPFSPASATAGGATFALTITGSSFVSGATVNFGSTQGLAATSVTATQIQVNIPATAIATAGTYGVVVNNPAPAVGPSTAQNFTVNNPVPTIASATSGGQNHAAGGSGFTLTVNGTNFVSGTNEASVVNFNGKAETTTYVSSTQITAAIPGSDVSTAGAVNVTVTNPGPGGGTTATSISFTVDGYTITGPTSPVTVKAGLTASIAVIIKPTANGFANPVTVSVSGLPKHTTFSPITVTPGNTQVTVTLSVETKASVPPPPSSRRNPPSLPMLRLLFGFWLAALLLGMYATLLIRKTPRLRRYAAVVPLTLVLLTGAILGGCAGMNGTPHGSSNLTITATSGTLSQTTSATLTVN